MVRIVGAMEFKEITLEDKDWMRQLLGYSDNRATEYNFTVLFIWREIMNTKVARLRDFLLVRFRPQGAEAFLYIFRQAGVQRRSWRRP